MSDQEAIRTIRAALDVLEATVGERKALEFDHVRDRFRSGARELARGAAQGVIAQDAFVFGIQDLILTWFPEAFLAGMAVCGVELDVITEATPEEQSLFVSEVQTDMAAVAGFSADISGGRYGSVEELAPLDPRAGAFAGLLTRVDMYVARLDHFFALGQAQACGNQMMQWELGPTKEHCIDCLEYHGQRHRMSTWERNNAIPQSRGLECGGWLCKCRLVPTSGKASGRLRPPRFL